MKRSARSWTPASAVLGAGRVAIPPALQSHASLQKDVLVAGSGDHFQIWDRKAWAEHRSSLGAKIDDLIQGLGHPA